MPIHKLKRKLGIRGPEQQQKEHDNALDRKETAEKNSKTSQRKKVRLATGKKGKPKW